MLLRTVHARSLESPVHAHGSGSYAQCSRCLFLQEHLDCLEYKLAMLVILGILMYSALRFVAVHEWGQMKFQS